MTVGSEAQFLEHRRELLGIAYRMLGSMADAEDAVQECFLRWQRQGGAVDSPRAFLKRVAINLCLDRLRAERRSRLDYVGTWLPEPFIHGDRTHDDPEYLVTGLSTAFLLMLERLTPLQRAVFLSKQVLGLDHTETAELLDISVESSRTHLRRAQQALSGDEPGRYPVDPEEHRRLLERFMFSIAAEDVGALRTLLAEDVVCRSDGGGRVAAASKPFSGAEAVIKFFLGIKRQYRDDPEASLVPVNGSYGIFLRSADGDSLVTLQSIDGKIAGLYVQRNPDKLQPLAERVEASARTGLRGLTGKGGFRRRRPAARRSR